MTAAHEIIPLFGELWWQANLVTVGAIVLVIILSLKTSKEQTAKLTIIIGVVMLGREIFFHPYVASLGRWTLQDSLPIHMCGVSAILAGIVMFWRNQTLYEFLMYWGIPGAFHSLLTPEFTQGTEGWLFPDYFLAHGGIILAALYATLVLGMRPRKGSWWRIALWSQIPIAAVFGFNFLINANYMYLAQKPIVDNPFIIGEWPWYILVLEVVGVLHALAVYAPFGMKYWKQQRTPEPGIV